MTENRSDARKQAELVFGKLQAPSTARERAFDEIDAIRIAGEEKTRKLRAARLAKQARDKEAVKERSASRLPDTP